MTKYGWGKCPNWVVEEGGNKVMMSWRWSEGAALSGFIDETTRNGRIFLNEAKPFQISKKQIWDAFKRVRANRGAVGADGQSIVNFKR